MSTQQVTERMAARHAAAAGTLRQELLDNEHVRVIETTYPVGASIPMHTHGFPHVIYVVEGGTLQTTTPDGTLEKHDLTPRETLWAKAQAHATRNIGSTPVRILEVEVRTSPVPLVGAATPHVRTPADMEWIPDPLDRTREVALLVGDPTKPGPYTVRIHAAAGYRIALHRHPSEDENLTVLSGSVHWSTGAVGSGAPEYVAPAGSLLVFPAGIFHRLWTTEATLLQMTGFGPRVYDFFNTSEKAPLKR